MKIVEKIMVSNELSLRDRNLKNVENIKMINKSGLDAVISFL
jgi:hypothetical protein